MNIETSKPGEETSRVDEGDFEFEARLEEFNALADDVLGPEVEDEDQNERQEQRPVIRRTRAKGIHRIVSKGLDWLCRSLNRPPRDTDTKDELAADVVEVVQEYVPSYQGTPVQNLAVTGGLVLLDVVFDEKLPEKEAQPDGGNDE